MPENESVSKKVSPTKIGLIVIGVAVVALLVWQQFAGPVAQEQDGTIASIDLAARQAALKVIDPANGVEREYRGNVPPECVITINGKPAQLEDLKEGDHVRVKARLDRKVRTAGDKKRPLIIADRVEVIRKDAEKKS